MPRAREFGFQDPTEGVRLVAGVDRIALCGRLPEIRHHVHSTGAVVVGVDGPLKFVAERTHSSSAVWIEPGFAHAVDVAGGRIAVFLLPPHAAAKSVRAAATELRDLPHPGRWVELGRAVLHGELADLEPVDHLLSRARVDVRPLDDRLRAAVELLEGNLDENHSVAELASRVRLSPSRLMALARGELGTSLRSLRRWLRTFRVAREYAAGASLTEAAIAAGFASSAHLSIAARAHFGVRPSHILSPNNREGIRTLGAA